MLCSLNFVSLHSISPLFSLLGKKVFNLSCQICAKLSALRYFAKSLGLSRLTQGTRVKREHSLSLKAHLFQVRVLVLIRSLSVVYPHGVTFSAATYKLKILCLCILWHWLSGGLLLHKTRILQKYLGLPPVSTLGRATVIQATRDLDCDPIKKCLLSTVALEEKAIAGRSQTTPSFG